MTVDWGLTKKLVIKILTMVGPECESDYHDYEQKRRPIFNDNLNVNSNKSQTSIQYLSMLYFIQWINRLCIWILEF